MLIASCIFVISLSQAAGLYLIARALGSQIPDVPPVEAASIHPTLSSDIGGLV